MAFIRKSGKTKIMWLPVAASAGAVTNGALMSYSSGVLIPATNTVAGNTIAGVIRKAITTADSDYAVARLVPIEVPVEKNVVWEAPVNVGTLASISLPANLKELEQAPALLGSDSRWTDYEEILPKYKYGKSSTDKYSYILGNPADGKTLVLNNPEANATLSIQYQRNASGMATLTDTCELEDCDYVVTKLNAYVLKARGDDKFQVIDAEANAKLKNMIGRSQKQPSGGSGSTPKTSNFVIGE